MFDLIEASRFVNDCEWDPTIHVGVTDKYRVHSIFSIAEWKYASVIEANQWNYVTTK
jgi:hypothetical protein